MSIMYKLKNDDLFNELGKNGYDLIPGTIIAFKIIEQDLDSDPVKYLLNRYYENPKWHEKIYVPNAKELVKTIGLKYKDGKPIMSKKFTQMLKSWRIEIDPNDEEYPNFLCFRSMDFHETLAYYGKQVLDKYCPDEIKTLLEKGLIEEVDVNEGRYMAN